MILVRMYESLLLWCSFHVVTPLHHVLLYYKLLIIIILCLLKIIICPLIYSQIFLIPIHPSDHPSIHPFIHPSIHLSIQLYIHTFNRPSINQPSIYLFINLSIYLFINLSINLPIYPSLYITFNHPYIHNSNYLFIIFEFILESFFSSINRSIYIFINPLNHPIHLNIVLYTDKIANFLQDLHLKSCIPVLTVDACGVIKPMTEE